MFRFYWLGIFVLGLLAANLLARQGTVITSDGRTIAGDIQESTDGKSVDITAHGATATVVSSDVASIKYPDDASADFQARLAALDPNDVKGRLDLSRAELDARQYDLAKQAANDAERLDPHNPDAVILLDTIASEKSLEAKAASLKSGANPELATTNPSSGQLLSMDDVYVIRRSELLPDDAVRVEFANKVRERLLGPHGDAADFYAKPLTQQALDILQAGDPNLSKDVHVVTDPHVLLDFRTRVLPRVLTGCAASGCHGSSGSGGFFLNRDAGAVLPAYTDFYILAKAGRKLSGGDTFGGGPVFRPMIDRVNPASSLLLQFGLPRTLAATPHPDVRGFKPMFRNETDQVYLDMLHWVDSLNPLAADYGIKFDLTPTKATEHRAFDVSPTIYLLLLLAVLFGTVLTGGLSRFRCRRHLRKCARNWNMHFAPGDRLRLAKRIAGKFPIIGAANIGVRDLLFRTEEGRHRYLFTVDFTVGVIRGKVGRSRVAGFTEPISRGTRVKPVPPALCLAAPELTGPPAYEDVMKKLDQ